jgi:chain length determinant protein tyrosine kinase EpsG
MRQTNVLPAAVGAIKAGGGGAKRSERLFGAILVSTGRLASGDAERILAVQQAKGLRFGDAGLTLGLLTESDISFALARQFGYPYLVPGESAVAEQVVAAYAPFSPPMEALRALRDQLAVRWFATEGKTLALVSAGRKEGRSFIAANLAVSFTQLGQRTLLIDADMRNPSQHRLFGLDNRAGLSSLLSDRCDAEAVVRVPRLSDLAVLPAGAVPPNPSELLARPLFGRWLDAFKEQFDVILLDTPAGAEAVDARTVTLRAGAAVIVVRKNATRMWRARGVADHASQARATVVGAVLNEF